MKNKALLVFVAVAGVSISGPMVKWSLSCGASPVMIAFGRMLISALLLLVPALKSGELAAVAQFVMQCVDYEITNEMSAEYRRKAFK